ncbi:MAG: flagellar type III secretion system protein FliR [Selenomonadaceae bacterium]|nr:flagellar type III secretion system protein FliR [Selenomonadaceae bacterium]
MDFFDVIQGQIAAFLLVLTRTSGIFFVSPFFGSQIVPEKIRAATAFAMAILTFPVLLDEMTIETPATVIMFTALVIQELFIGWLIGFVGYIILAAITMSGKIMDMQVGFTIAQVMDPTSHEQSPLIGSFLYNLTIIYFLAVNGHHMIVAALVESFRAVPFNSIAWNPSIADFMINLTNGIFLVGMKIAMPVTFSILMTNVGMGILARTMPQMNIFVIGVPMHLMIGTAMLALLMPFYVLFLDVMFDDMYANISTAIKLIAP